LLEEDFAAAVRETPDDDVEEASDAGAEGEEEEGEGSEELGRHVGTIIGEVGGKARAHKSIGEDDVNTKTRRTTKTGEIATDWHRRFFL